ncbi:MAG TPA: glycosyltransferase [Patescibacteria group bacterium]|nr:glycosyltransferase [Patescibacteria group bacterium]
MTKKPTLVFLSTYPPRKCGIATFTQDLVHSIEKLTGPTVECKIAALNLSESDAYEYPKEVYWQLIQTQKEDFSEFAETINNDDSVSAVVIQHEYGIYGGEFGDNLLAFTSKCKKPISITFHTVIPDPPYKMQNVTSELIDHATRIVVLTETSRQIIESIYQNAIGKVVIIPHGIHPVSFSAPGHFKNKLMYTNKTLLTTFGLLSRSKGIEYVIKAMPKVVKQFPDVVYLILGETHPVVRLQEGESYRNELYELVDKLHLKKHVKFYDKYFSVDDLLTFLKATDIYISTSLAPNQAVSGTFSYALGTGRAVVSTDFAQAKEYLHKDLGEIVPMKNPQAYADAIIKLLSQKKKLYTIHRRAYNATRNMVWSNVALEYLKNLDVSIIPEINLKHLIDMTDDFGMFQFAKGKEADSEFGYTLDDNARAAVACSLLIKKGQKRIVTKELAKYIKFIEHCIEGDKLLNYIDYPEHMATEQNNLEDLQDTYARTLWALSEVITNEKIPANIRRDANKIWKKISLKAIDVTHLRSRAFTIKALCNIVNGNKNHPFTEIIKKHAEHMVNAFYDKTSEHWHWFEHELTYSNAIIPESLLLAGCLLDNREFLEVGEKALGFLIKHTFINDLYFPIGQNGWFKKRKARAHFDQQPEDPASMVLALTTAWRCLKDPKYSHLAFQCFSWFLGNNMLGYSMYDYTDGSSFDAITPSGVNHNQGAESLLSYLLARLKIEEIV